MRLFKRFRGHPGLLILHLALLLVLAGGIITALTAREGTVILRPGETATTALQADGTALPLGFTLGLENFETEYYPSSETPRNYLSHITIDGRPATVGVNAPVSAGRFRIYQSSFLDEHTPVLAVRADLPGTATVFAGFALFLIGGIIWLAGRWRRTGAFILLGLAALGARAEKIPVLNPEVVDSLQRQTVICQGRAMTVSTVCRDALRKVSGARSYRGLSAERAMLSFAAFPAQWADQPIIRTKAGLRSLRDCFGADGRYLMAGDRDADERVGILLMLTGGSLMTPAEEPLSPARTEAELLYNRVPATMIVFIGLFLAALGSLWRRGAWLAWAVLAFEGVVIGLECWFTGHGPFSNMFETLQFLSLMTGVIALTVRGMRTVGLFAAGAMALVAHLQYSNPVMTQLMPVLHSPWLSLHVSLVMTSYALLVLASLTALAGILRPSRADLLRPRALQLLRPGLFLLGLGIASGAVWANESWGRYWGWDPKETWALITFLLYAIPLHRRRPALWLIALPLLSVLMTYFGVNYLPSLHSYAR